MQTLLGNLLGYFTGALNHQSGTVVVYSADARKNLSGSVVTHDLRMARYADRTIEIADGKLAQ